MGHSSPHPGRSYRTWAADVGALADSIGADRFAVVGFSSGGPHAIACAAELPSRVAALGVVSGDGPYADALPEMMVKFHGEYAPVPPDVAEARSSRSADELRASYAGMKKADRREMALADLVLCFEAWWCDMVHYGMV